MTCYSFTLSKSNISAITVSMSFCDAYASLLEPFLKSYKGAKNIKERTTVIKNAADAVLKSSNLLEDKGLELPNDVKTVGFFFIIHPSPKLLTSSGHHSIF